MYFGVLIFCVAGTHALDKPDPGSCVTYTSDKYYVTEKQCKKAIKSVKTSDVFQALVSLPGYDLELHDEKCIANQF
jgi:hypothetical protein